MVWANTGAFSENLSDSKVKRRLLFVSILVFVAIVGILVWLLRRKPTEVTVLGPYDVGTTKRSKELSPKWNSMLGVEETKLSAGNNVTCSFFVYMEDASASLLPGSRADMEAQQAFDLPATDRPQHPVQYLLTLGNIVGIAADPVFQELRVDVNQTPPVDQTSGDVPVKTKSVRTLIAPNLLAARWNQVTICVEGRSIDVFINGILATSMQLDNVPAAPMSGLFLNASPDFQGQVALFQVWAERRTSQQILENYKRNTDTRGKPLLPAPAWSWDNLFSKMKEAICTGTGFCGIRMASGPLEYVEYEFA